MEARNYYEDLFSPDTADTSQATTSQDYEAISNLGNAFTLSGISILNDTEENNLKSASSDKSFRLSRANFHECKSYCSGSDMDISSGNLSSSTLNSYSSSDEDSQLTSICSGDSFGTRDDDLCDNQDTTLTIDAEVTMQSPPPPVISFLDEEEISNLLGENVQLPNPEPREVLEKHNMDIIGSFNVRNKYDHVTAGELLIKEKLSFLAIQEPYASSHKVTESWKAFQKLELQSARIECYETPYQIILFDSWKWGGKVFLPFQSFQYGRITSIGFNLGDKLQVGIISVYAPSKDPKNVHFSENETHPTMKVTNNLIQKLLSKWKKTHPDMVTIVLGDFQETVSDLDRDNLGTYRRLPTEEGALMGMSDSHESIVRKLNPSIPYVTRFGHEGARGIDHIFFPSDEKFGHICGGAKIQRDKGANYFPSDHSLITCSISRPGQNNNCFGQTKDKFDYSKLFSIKLRQTGIRGKDMDFDHSQFKNCEKFKDQLALFKEIQKKTNNDSYITKEYLDGLDERADYLFKSLWDHGISQASDGPTNKLVQITDEHAMELSYILNGFNDAVKLVMKDQELVNEVSNNDSAGTTRGRLRTRKGFKAFNNLPVPTKLRYLKVMVEAKLKSITKSIYWMKEFRIRNKYESIDSLSLNQDSFWNQWRCLPKDDLITKRAREVVEVYENEVSERTSHISAIQYENEKKVNQSSRSKNDDRNPTTGNNLPDIPDNITRLLNFWLASSGCKQGFDSKNPSGGSSAFLTERIHDWKKHITELDIEDFDLKISHQYKMIEEGLEKAQADIQKLCTQILKLQVYYRRTTLDYFLESNKIGSFTDKVSFTSRQAPATHTSIWDPSIQEFRTCIDELEELRATSAFHGNWMANSAAQEVCAFAKITSIGRLGNRGIKLNPDRVVSMKDISSLIQNGDKLPRKIKRAFIKAHGKHVANLFREPTKDNIHFNYPFYMVDSAGTVSEEENLEKKLWKAISSIPTKARFEGFQLAVLGRFAPKWRQLLLKIVKLILIMRYIPPALKKMARFPIPKPGRHNEYRPISLCHDLYCFIMGIVTSYSSAAIEKAGILHKGLTAYQKGKGCANLVTTELSFREDCLEGCMPAVQIDEDEEKFFDRIPVEVLLAAMRVNGFPNQGFIEIKASAMESKTVEIITAKGVTYARFICGLEQGNPDSPTVSNLVIKFKHDVWGHISDEIKEILKRNHTCNQEKYKFNSINKKDGQLYLCKIGYSDDNSKYISLRNEEDLLSLVKYYTQLSGDISMVTKIGRKSAKCEVQFFNISAKLALRMEKVWSTAWSFVDDSPIQEQIPFKIHMTHSELQNFYHISNFFNLDDEKQAHWNKIICAEAHKHLGLSSTLSADTSTAWRSTIEKMKGKLNKLNIYKMHICAQRKCFNMLIGTMPTFVPVQINFPSKELLEFDKYAAAFCLKANGLSKSDTKIRMFLPENLGGLGLISTMELDLIAVAREFEIISNNVTLDSHSFRTRISALENYSISSLFQTKNHAREAIAKLARYGLYIRSTEDKVINDVLAEINTSNKLFLPITRAEYKDPCNVGIGLGKEKNTQLMHGGPIHSILRLLQANHWKQSTQILETAKPFRISVPSLISAHSKIKANNCHDLLSFFSFWEWNNAHQQSMESIPCQQGHWKFKNLNSVTEKRFSDSLDCITNPKSHLIKVSSISWKINVRTRANSDELDYNLYSWEGRMLKFVMESNSPILIATDGAHFEKGHHRKTSSSFVFCTLDIREGECLETLQWTDRPVLPLFSRNSILPQNFGSCKTDIAHGEFNALLMAEMALSSMPRITISDSKAIREQMLRIRDLESNDNDRNYIRSIAGGVGKFLCGTMRHLLLARKNIRNSSLNSPAMTIIYDKLLKRNVRFLNIAKSWTTPVSQMNENMEITGWEENYFDTERMTPILKVNSHQLDQSGTKIKAPARYKTLIPNLAMLSANHFADKCADYAKQFEHAPFSFNRPPSFLRFFLTCDGINIDRHISDFCHEQFSQLKVRKLRLRKTQGLLWRILHHTTTSWEVLNLYKGWFRSLLGLSSTHTRRLYKSEVYRACSKAKFKTQFPPGSSICKEIDNSTTSKVIEILSGCLWCSRNLQNAEKGNRNHILLSCKEKNIQEFRFRVSNLIELKFQIFFTLLAKATNGYNVIQCIKEIEKAFMDLQHTNTGRLSPVAIIANARYISISSILQREKLSSIEEALKSKQFNFCGEIFGLYPHTQGAPVMDENIGVADCPWLGLMPTVIDNIMSSFCSKIVNFIPHDETRTSISNNLKHSWREIKTLIMGRAIGLHRIINSSGKELEKKWRKEFKIDLNSFKKLKEDSNPKSILTLTRAKRKFDTTDSNIVQEPNKRIRNAPIARKEVDLKVCTGITCNDNYKSWYGHSTFSTNKIKTTIKQCQRCGRFMTTLRQSRQLLSDIEATNKDETEKELFDFTRKNQLHLRYKYKEFAYILNKHSQASSNENIIPITKTRIQDRFKLICNVICTSIKKASNNFTVTESNMIQRSISILDKTLAGKESDFTLNREAETKIRLLINDNNIPCKGNTGNPRKIHKSQLEKAECRVIGESTNSDKVYHIGPSALGDNDSISINQQQASSDHISISSDESLIIEDPNPSFTTSTLQKDKSTVQQIRIHKDEAQVENAPILKLQNKEKLKCFASNIIRPHICLSGDEMMKAIEVLRSYKVPNLHIATAEASNQITTGRPTQSWSDFARMFGSRALNDNKPNGVYLIPLFSGETRAGHWYLCVVQKLGQRWMKGWCMDSLGQGSTSGNLFQKIEMAFAPGRAKLTWNTCQCRRQEELECGPRTIFAMKLVMEGMIRNMNFDDCVKQATLQHSPYNLHTPIMIREKIAYLVNKYEPSMITPIIRRRRRSLNATGPKGVSS